MCKHLTRLLAARPGPVQPSSQGCQECLERGSGWVHLRLCLTCGHVGCCDSSPNRHATKHFHATRHPTMKSFEPGEDWAWCYLDEEMVEAIPAFPVESPPHHYAPGGAPG
ncbi:MAG TPA: UBP-type zinc finger domain-containing protein [Anaeromyxobacter sp.]|nr:UBP-type zinc finger domain-containing protein [Anaeromyxobacter sp.]